MNPTPSPGMGAWKALLLTAGAVLGMRAAILIAAAVRGAREDAGLEEVLPAVLHDPANLGLAQLLSFGIVLWFAVGARPPGEALGLRAVSFSTLALSAILGVSLRFLIGELANLLYEVWPIGVERQLKLQRLLTPDTIVDGFLVVFAFVLVSPVTEELLFRGVFRTGLRERYGPVTTLLFTSVLFGAAHVQLVPSIYATVAGLVLGGVALRSNSTIPALTVHIAANALPVLLSSRVVEIPGFNLVGEQVYHLPAALLISAAFLAILSAALLARESNHE